MSNYYLLDIQPRLDSYFMGIALPLTLSAVPSNPYGWQRAGTVFGYDQDAGMHQWYRFDAVAGARYEIVSNSYFDPTVVFVYDKLGRAIAVNGDESDDGPPDIVGGLPYSRDVIHDWVAPYTGTYYVSAGWRQDSGHPYYSLTVSEDAHTTFPTTKVIPSVTSAPEGSVVSYFISSPALAPGTVLNWMMTGVGVTPEDFVLKSSGTVTISGNGTASFSVMLANDRLTEGPEIMTAVVGDSSGVLATSAGVVILDTSVSYHLIVGTNGNDILIGTDDHDEIRGLGGDDVLQGGPGNDVLYGGDGKDVAQYAGTFANYTIQKSSSGDAWTVTDNIGLEGTDTLYSIETLRFADFSVALDLAGTAGQAYRIYQAAFNRAADPAGLGFWMDFLDKGGSVQQMAAGFIASQEFQSLYGSAPTNSELLNSIYHNVLHREPDKGGFDYWLGVLDKQGAPLSAVLASFSESPENQAALIKVIGSGIVYSPYH